MAGWAGWGVDFMVSHKSHEQKMFPYWINQMFFFQNFKNQGPTEPPRVGLTQIQFRFTQTPLTNHRAVSNNPTSKTLKAKGDRTTCTSDSNRKLPSVHQLSHWESHLFFSEKLDKKSLTSTEEGFFLLMFSSTPWTNTSVARWEASHDR